jgi:hypothetical protein
VKEGEIFGSITGKPTGGFHYENFTINTGKPYFGPEDVCLFVIRCMLDELERIKEWRAKEHEDEMDRIRDYRFYYSTIPPSAPETGDKP